MIKQFLLHDTPSRGAIAVLLSELLAALLVSALILVLHFTFLDHARWFVLCFLPALFVTRFYMKQKTHLRATKGAIVALFVTFLAFMAFLFKHQIL